MPRPNEVEVIYAHKVKPGTDIAYRVDCPHGYSLLADSPGGFFCDNMPSHLPDGSVEMIHAIMHSSFLRTSDER